MLVLEQDSKELKRAILKEKFGKPSILSTRGYKNMWYKCGCSWGEHRVDEPQNYFASAGGMFSGFKFLFGCINNYITLVKVKRLIPIVTTEWTVHVNDKIWERGFHSDEEVFINFLGSVNK